MVDQPVGCVRREGSELASVTYGIVSCGQIDSDTSIVCRSQLFATLTVGRACALLGQNQGDLLPPLQIRSTEDVSAAFTVDFWMFVDESDLGLVSPFMIFWAWFVGCHCCTLDCQGQISQFPYMFCCSWDGEAYIKYQQLTYTESIL